LLKTLSAFHRLRGAFSLLTAPVFRLAEAANAAPFAATPEPVAAPGRQRGQAIVEMVLVLPIIFIFIVVVVDFGLALDRREVVQHGIREGARAAAVGKSITEVRDVTVDQSKGLFAPGNVQVCYVDEDGNNLAGNAGDSVRVSGTYVYEFLVGSAFLGIGDVTMTPSAEARLETSVAGATEC
jgi:hypothetical protein